ncbi:MAG: hypothetical protein PQJ50_02515 [Spirochaetales bacterium]|nr:hypothetical protein [Spirochaetales bacterium]
MEKCIYYIEESPAFKFENPNGLEIEMVPFCDSPKLGVPGDQSVVHHCGGDYTKCPLKKN